LTTLAGKLGTRGHADGIGNEAEFWWPTGLAVDQAGNVFVADCGNNTIRQVSPVETN
jgi:DNA-binding beta-propeller fold protein YncE